MPLTLLPLTLLPLTLLPLALPSGVCQVPPGILEARRGLGQVAVGLDVGLGAGHRLAEPVERGARPRRVALGKTLRGIAQGRRRAAVGTGRGRLHLGQLAGKLTLFLRGHLVELVAEPLEVVLG
ncbi:MAG: hypothetical protein ACRDGH_11470, partial [Candidatus Limnocylindria bacterium]